jgi:hypothetical protein
MKTRVQHIILLISWIYRYFSLAKAVHHVILSLLVCEGLFHTKSIRILCLVLQQFICVLTRSK